MPAALSPPQPRTDNGDFPPTKKWTREECEALEQAGLVGVRDYELIEGVLVQKTGKKLLHIRALSRLIQWLVFTFESKVVPEPGIDVAPVDNPTSQPEPDVVVLRASVVELVDTIRSRDIRMVAEVSDTTLSFDLGPKARLYARAGIEEYWVLDVNGRRLIVHQQPETGEYRSIQAFAEDETVQTPLTGEATIVVRELL
ncbi:MAG: Uma2 family endonuclease [Bryobacteraceae bacterium]